MFPRIAREAARRHPDRALFVSLDGQVVTYADFDRLSDQVAAGLVQRGVGAGDVVCLALPSRPEYAVLLLAATKVGAVTAGINPALAPLERGELVELADASLVVATADLLDGLPQDRMTEVVERAGQARSMLASLRGPETMLTDLAPEDLDRDVAIVFTSGTTGLPKGAVFTERQLDAMVRLDVGMKWGEGGHIIASTQFAHVGFTNKLPAQVRSGVTIHWMERWSATEVLRLTDALRLPALGGVAPQIALLLAHPSFDTFDLTAVDTVLAGGGPSSPALVAEARDRFGADYLVRYSCTQSGGVGTTTARDASLDEILHTVGRARPGVEVAVRGESGEPVPVGEVGEICLRADTVMDRYWDDPSASAEALRAGWLHTGDLGTMDGAGVVRIVGRAKEMFIRGGYNVFPVEVEAVLSTHPAVRQVVVVPRPDPLMGEIGVAVVIPTDPTRPPSLEDLRGFASDRLAVFKLPEALRVVEQLPYTGMLKIDRRKLAAAECPP